MSRASGRRLLGCKHKWFCWTYRWGPIDCDLVSGLVNTNEDFHAMIMISELLLDE
jgi:hypothetical protein